MIQTTVYVPPGGNVISLGRRTFLKAGLAAIAIPRTLSTQQDVPRRVKGVLWLWMNGGMSQFATWDPKLSGPFKSMNTEVQDVQISELLPTCARQMKHLSIIRTVFHREGDLERAAQLVHTGVAPEGGEVPTIGTIISSELGKPGFPLPSNIAIDLPVLTSPPTFGEDHTPFHLNNRFNPIPNIRRCVDANRDRARVSLVQEQNKEWTALRQQREARRAEAAFSRSEAIMNTPLLNAFLWQEEPELLRKEYGGAFGENCLLARRLIQAGCAFVEVGLGGWHPRTDFVGNMKRVVPELDRGLGTLVKDLVDKELLSEVVVVCATEFGKSPDVNGDERRIPWPRGYSVVLAGGVLAGGRIHGSTGPDGKVCDQPVSVPDLLATIYRACGLDPDKEYTIEEGRRMKYGQGGKPVANLF